MGPADEYLSGKVVDKLAEAEAAAKKDQRFQENVIALKAVQPEYIESYDITVQIGAPWINQKYYKQVLSRKNLLHIQEKKLMYSITPY